MITKDVERKKNNLKQKGITLIALIITIIILLILAGVVINIIINGGLLGQAQNATDRYKQAENDEMNNLDKALAKIDTMNGENSDNNGSTIDPGVIETANAGDVLKTENNIKYTSDGQKNVIPVPVGFSYAGEGTKDTGFVIKNDTDENEFVWIPVSGMPYTYNRYAFVGGEINQVEDGIDTEFGTNSVKIKTSKSSSTYFVEELPNDEKASVEKHGGYYIARYEAGILQERTAKGEPATTLPIFRKTGDTAVYVYNFVKYDQAKTLSENLYKKSEDNVISKLCSNYAWDTALKFIDIQNPGWSTNSVGGDNTTLQGPGYHSVNNIYDIGGNVDEMVSGFYCSPEYQFILRRWEMFFTEIVQCIQHVI